MSASVLKIQKEYIRRCPYINRETFRFECRLLSTFFRHKIYNNNDEKPCSTTPINRSARRNSSNSSFVCPVIFTRRGRVRTRNNITHDVINDGLPEERLAQGHGAYYNILVCVCVYIYMYAYYDLCKKKKKITYTRNAILPRRREEKKNGT